MWPGIGVEIRYVEGILVDSTPAPAYRPVEGDPPEVPGLGYWNQPFVYLDQENNDDALPGDFPFWSTCRSPNAWSPPCKTR